MIINKQVEEFIIVAEKRSFSEAARTLYLTQPALSRQIQTLESAIGFPLFERTKKGVILTKMGESFYEDMKKLILFEKDAIERARALAIEQENIIKMCLFNEIVELMSIQLGLQNFAIANPEVKIQYIKAPFNFKNKKEMLLSNLIDIFWREGLEFDNDDCKLGFTELFQDSVSILVAKDHPLASHQLISPEDLFGWTLTIPKPDGSGSSVSSVIYQFLTERYPQIRLEINDPESSDYLGVQHGTKLMLLNTYFAQFVPYIRAVPFNCDFPRTKFGFVHKANPSTTIRLFIQSIQASLKK